MSNQILRREFLQKSAALAVGSLANGSLPALSETSRPKPEIVSVRKIWDQAPHNAFTDLIRFRQQWYSTFREADVHGAGEDGKVQVLVSADGEEWKSVALLAEDGIDLRDPKLSITPDGRLMLLAGGSVYERGTYRTRQPRVAFSSDGGKWSATQRILGDGHWLWRVTWHEGRAYGVSKLGEGNNPRRGFLYRSTDGLHYELITELHVPGVSETTLRFLEGGEMMALVRHEEGNKHGWIGTSQPPYTRWTWHETEYRLGGPNFIQIPDGTLWASSRRYHPDGNSTVLAEMGRELYKPVLTLPSGGDTSYPGLVWHDELLWMSYYSSHEAKTSIYLAKIRHS
ncbi:exo-alpha-sialidase [Acidobacteria bacterium AH-259-G07]|nr:exo-alpha-sialidase [Acidobacteria bacterium AH-259-G07]